MTLFVKAVGIQGAVKTAGTIGQFFFNKSMRFFDDLFV